MGAENRLGFVREQVKTSVNGHALIATKFPCVAGRLPHHFAARSGSPARGNAERACDTRIDSILTDTASFRCVTVRFCSHLFLTSNIGAQRFKIRRAACPVRSMSILKPLAVFRLEQGYDGQVHEDPSGNRFLWSLHCVPHLQAQLQGRERR
jgi:hypothetical protein